jgi:histidinol dehydrogenase
MPSRPRWPGWAAGDRACPTPGGAVNPLVLLAARLAGVDTVYRIGGAQAIAALAYGTETIAPVDKITGPGNAYVAAAKRRVFGRVGIDMIAGPSEILVIADGDAGPGLDRARPSQPGRT